MAGGIFLVSGDELVEMREQPYDSEDLLQTLLAKYPSLLTGDEDDEEGHRRWLLVKRETRVPMEEGGGGRWSLDHLFIDQEAVPTLVEVKRSTDTRIRREVVGQMLDYAANGVVYWPIDRLRSDFTERCVREGNDPDVVFEESLGEDVDPEAFWQSVEQNLQVGRVRLVFVADEIPGELRRVIEFLNERMTPTEVLGIEIRQYVGAGDHTTLVPRVIGQTEQARTKKTGGSRPALEADWDYYEHHLPDQNYATAKKLFERLESAFQRQGLDWKPRLRRNYLAFLSQGQPMLGAEMLRRKPIEFWIKLPRSPDEIPELAGEQGSPYPDLVARWNPRHKQWHWEVPTPRDVPDVELAIQIARRFRSESS